MALQIAFGGVRVGKRPTERIFYCPTHGRVVKGDERVSPHLLSCSYCSSFLEPRARIGTRQRIKEVAAKWGLRA
jgi:hypothetical protein